MTPWVIACCYTTDSGADVLPSWYAGLHDQTVKPHVAYVLFNNDPTQERAVVAVTTKWRELTSPHHQDPYPVFSSSSLPIDEVYDELIARVVRGWPQATHVLIVGSNVTLGKDSLKSMLDAKADEVYGPPNVYLCRRNVLDDDGF